jgi:hypothetical protein
VAGAVVGAVVALSPPVRMNRPGPSPSPPPRVEEAVERAVVGKAPVDTVLAWTPGALPVGYASAIRGHPAIRSVAVVRSGVAWLEAWTDASGDRSSPPPGMAVPVEVAAVEPATYRDFVPPADRQAIGRLAGGGAVLGRTGAELRRVGPGARLRLGSSTLRVGAVLDDELVGAHEVVVSTATGSVLGIVRPRYLLIDPRAGVSRRRVESLLRRLVPAGIRLRVRTPGETPVFRHGDAVLPAVRIKELFGEFAAEPMADGSLQVDPSWSRANIRTGRVPILGSIECHRLVVPLVRRAMAELARRGLSDLVDPGQYGGCFVPRFIGSDPGTGLSHHSWGVAIDINVAGNLTGQDPTIDPRVVEVMEHWGFTWGGRFLVPDGTHFEFLRFPRTGTR